MHTESQAVYNDHLGLFLTYPFLFENGYIFSPLWCTVHRYSVKSVPNNTSFQKRGGGGGEGGGYTMYICLPGNGFSTE